MFGVRQRGEASFLDTDGEMRVTNRFVCCD